MEKRIFVFSCFVYLSISLSAQVNPCATHDIAVTQAAQYPGYGIAMENTFEQARQWAEANGLNKSGETYQVPVVVHIVYTSAEENLPDAVVLDQIDVLNADFSRKNTDAVDTRKEFTPLATDAGIQFYLATKDPWGNPTTGITRTSGNPANGSFSPFSDNVKFSSTGGKDAWPTDRYLNIWVCNLAGNLGVLGYAYPPVGEVPGWPEDGQIPQQENKQGVVIHYSVFGSNNPFTAATFPGSDHGRTTTHEVGHYFGLRHIWGDGDCSKDDGIEDTPDASTSSLHCSFDKNTCTESSGTELPDNVENFMDYTPDACRNMFTKGQVAQMRAIIELFRPELVKPGDTETHPTTGIENEIENRISIYPNPVQTSFAIAVSDISIGVTEGRITDMTGATIRVWSNGQTQIDMTGLAPGIYFLQLKTTKGEVTKKIVKA